MKICLQLHISNEIIPIKTQNNKNSGKNFRKWEETQIHLHLPTVFHEKQTSKITTRLQISYTLGSKRTHLRWSWRDLANTLTWELYIYMYICINWFHATCHVNVYNIYIYSVTSCTMQPLCKWFQKELKGTSNDTGFPLRSYFLGDLFRSWGHLLRARIIMRVDGKKKLQYHWAFE